MADSNRNLDLDLTARITRLASRQLRWEFDLNARQAAQNVIGGGIIFKFELAAFGAQFGEPVLLPGNRGWTWSQPNRSRIELRFEPPLASVYFERGQKSEVRAFCYKGDIPQGSRRIMATLEVSGKATIVPSRPERFGLEDHAKWPADLLDWKASPVDLSFLTEQLFNEPISPANSIALRTAAEKGRLVITLPQTKELPWLEKSMIPAGDTIITDPKQSLINREATETVSDTGELRRSREHGTYTIDTPRSQAATGWIGGKRISLADVDIAATTRNATVAVQSLDGNPIRKSGAILISLGARSIPKSANQLPFHSEPVEEQLTIRAPGGPKLYTQNRTAEKGSPHKYTNNKSADKRQEFSTPSYKGGRYLINLDRDPGTYWLVLK